MADYSAWLPSGLKAVEVEDLAGKRKVLKVSNKSGKFFSCPLDQISPESAPEWFLVRLAGL